MMPCTTRVTAKPSDAPTSAAAPCWPARTTWSSTSPPSLRPLALSKWSRIPSPINWSLKPVKAGTRPSPFRPLPVVTHSWPALRRLLPETPTKSPPTTGIWATAAAPRRPPSIVFCTSAKAATMSPSPRPFRTKSCRKSRSARPLAEGGTMGGRPRPTPISSLATRVVETSTRQALQMKRIPTPGPTSI